MFEKPITMRDNFYPSGMDNYYFIRLTDFFLKYFQNGARSSCKDVMTRWHLAITLVHEVAHAFYCEVHRKPGETEIEYELCYNKKEDEQEMGWSLERYLFIDGMGCDNEFEASNGVSAIDAYP